MVKISGSESAALKEAGLYIHIPFCDHKCIYCDFYSITPTDKINEYIEALIKEIAYYSSSYKKTHNFTSVFFGGGTPSFIEPGLIQRIIEALRSNYNLSPDTEITLETNPGTVDENKLKEFLAAGVNRISIGIQSFNEDELKFLTRIHNAELAKSTVLLAQESGFKNISIDLIFNLPGQTKEIWEENLKQAMALPIQHISAYSLILEKGTILNKMVLDGKVTLQDDDYDADLYEYTIQYLKTKGFKQYEVSNFCKTGYECVHNNHYWRYRDYLSFGTSSHSFVNGKRWWNFKALSQYLLAIEKTGHARANEETPTKRQIFDEYVMLALRSKGIDKKDFLKRFGDSWFREKSTELRKYMHLGYLVEEGSIVRCTPDGYAIADSIIEQLLS